MKDKILLFVIGVLTGAIISTGIFFIYTKNITTCENNRQFGMREGTPPEMPNGGNKERPERPVENNMQNNGNIEESN